MPAHSYLQESADAILTSYGFEKKGRVWRRTTDQLVWLIELDGPSRTNNRYGLDIGAELLRLATSVPRRPTDCGLLIHAENLPLAAPPDPHDPRLADFGSTVRVALDLGIDMTPGERSRLARFVLESVARYAAAIADEQALRDRYRARDFDSAFISRGVRSVLDGV